MLAKLTAGWHDSEVLASGVHLRRVRWVDELDGVGRTRTESDVRTVFKWLKFRKTVPYAQKDVIHTSSCSVHHKAISM